jgi:hypothetical protein
MAYGKEKRTSGASRLTGENLDSIEATKKSFQDWKQLAAAIRCIA